MSVIANFVEEKKKLPQRTLCFFLFIKGNVRKAKFLHSFANFALSKAFLYKIFALFAVKINVCFLCFPLIRYKLNHTIASV
ncbi:hypothetical protein D0817_02555 [Flavobacterium cupreum]|uniref:Uncharacterized protein n=1 Tax=Flavobacterium cupreum TaxID=2133766 RepID=A0A434ADR0_9FLAO|nr:hypothetical protein D0817_02555 [Flavobacterium cupreum]